MRQMPPEYLAARALRQDPHLKVQAAVGEETQDPQDAGLSDVELAMLDLERGWFKYAGAKESAIRERFGCSATRYYMLLDALIDRPEAMAVDPLLVKRLLRLRAARQRQRSAAARGF